MLEECLIARTMIFCGAHLKTCIYVCFSKNKVDTREEKLRKS